MNGKFKLFGFSLFNRRFELHYNITEDCTTTIRNKGLFKFQIYKKEKLDSKAKYKITTKKLYERQFEFLQLK